MHETKIFEQKSNQKNVFLPIYLKYPIFFRTVTGNKHFFLGLKSSTVEVIIGIHINFDT